MFGLNDTDIQAIILSLQVAGAATIITLPAGFFCAYLLARTQFYGKILFSGLINLPLVLPPVVTGYLLLLLFGRSGWIGSMLETMNIRIIFSLNGAILASSIVGFPLLVRAIRIGLENVDPHLVQAARTLGASWFNSLFTITIPLCDRAILAGMSLMFARSLGEFGATIVLAGNIPGVTQTIPLAIFQYTTTPGGDRAALLLCLVSISLSLLVLILSETLNRRLAGRSAR
jgi:molybdate transport system permease protein